MKLSDIMASHGWVQCKMEKDYNKLKVYQKDNLLPVSYTHLTLPTTD